MGGRARRAATAPRAVLAGLAVLLGLFAMAIMHGPLDAGSGPADAMVQQTLTLGHPAGATAEHAAHATTPSPPLTPFCTTCGDGGESAMAACALALAAAVVLLLGLPRRLDLITASPRLPRPRSLAAPWHPAAPNLRALGISRT